MADEPKATIYTQPQDQRLRLRRPIRLVWLAPASIYTASMWRYQGPLTAILTVTAGLGVGVLLNWRASHRRRKQHLVRAPQRPTAAQEDPTMQARGLVFSAIAMRQNEDLEAIIGAADYLNRTVLTPSEFEEGIRALLGAQLIEETAPLRFRLTESGRDLWASTGSDGVITRFIRVIKLLPVDVPSVDWTVDRQAFEDAEAGYRDWMNHR